MTQSFRTEIKLEPSQQKIHPTSEVCSFGSCFADHIHRHLSSLKIKSSRDPLGIAYNPMSIAKRIKAAINHDPIDPRLVVKREDKYCHYDAHSQVMEDTKETLLRQLEKAQHLTRDLLLSADILIITWGTTVIHRHLTYNQTVANCHKQSSSLFNKEILTLELMQENLSQALTHFFQINAEAKVILTVSPVRHTKEGLAQNSLSKASLRVLCSSLQSQFDRVSYFPSFEIMVDDLRSYRFYEDDLIHPNKVAQDYIFDKFEQCYFDKILSQNTTKWKQLSKRLQHRPLSSKGTTYFNFLQNTLVKLQELDGDLDLSVEISELQKELSNLSKL